MSSVLKKF